MESRKYLTPIKGANLHQRTSDLLIQNKIKISMDGKGRRIDNVFVERLWRSAKYEEVYLKGYKLITEAKREIKSYFVFYNQGRKHQGLDYKTTDAVYFATSNSFIDKRLELLAAV
jgi:transposase InsO family protein